MNKVNRDVKENFSKVAICDLKKESAEEPVAPVNAAVDVQRRIRCVRGVQVILDKDLAELYDVPVKRLNEQVKRNLERFPDDFMFQLSKDECLRSQIATLNGKRGEHFKYLPYAFTESGVAMLSGVLRSDIAVAVNIQIMRAFVAMRKTLSSLAPIMARLENAERRQIIDQSKNEERFKLILDAMDDHKFPPQKVFFDGQFFDAFAQMKKFVRMARTELIIIDPYFSDSVLELIAQKRPGVEVVVVKGSRNRQLHSADVMSFNRQYADSLQIKVSDLFHDRFIIIDRSTLIHVGASLNCLGKKCFAFNSFDSSNILGIIEKLP